MRRYNSADVLLRGVHPSCWVYGNQSADTRSFNVDQHISITIFVKIVIIMIPTVIEKGDRIRDVRSDGC